MAKFLQLTDSATLDVKGACTCCGDFDVEFQGKVMRYESGDRGLAAKHEFARSRGFGTQVQLPVGAVLKSLEECPK
jgi:hypothetical protein